MLQMWSFGPGDLVDVDGTGMGASLLKLWNPTGVRRQPGEGGNVPMEAANAGDSTYYDRGLGEGASGAVVHRSSALRPRGSVVVFNRARIARPRCWVGGMATRPPRTKASGIDLGATRGVL